MPGQWVEQYVGRGRNVNKSDPEELDYNPSVRACCEPDPADNFLCSRPQGHTGKHVAHSNMGSTFLCSWIDQPSAATAQSCWRVTPTLNSYGEPLPIKAPQLAAEIDEITKLWQKNNNRCPTNGKCNHLSPVVGFIGQHPCDRVLGHSGDHVLVYRGGLPFTHVSCAWTSTPSPTFAGGATFPIIDPKTITKTQPMMAKPKVQPNCECGAHKLGVKDGMVGHSDWCRASVFVAKKQLRDVKF